MCGLSEKNGSSEKGRLMSIRSVSSSSFSLRRFSSTSVASVLVLVSAVVLAREPAPGGADEFRPLFNGRDLEGWVPVNVAPGTFTVRDGMLHSTGVPTGILRTDRQYENFILELEWNHQVAGGNAGLFVWSWPMTAPGTPFARAIEVQILDGRNSESYTSHGDVFAIHGAEMTPDRPHPMGWPRCLPSERRCRPAGEWNHYRVSCIDGRVKLAVNGKEVSGGSSCLPRRGYIAIESEGGEVLYRNIRIRELEPSAAKGAPGGETAEKGDPRASAPLAAGYRSLYTGVDLSGWIAGERDREHWTAKDWILFHDGKAGSETPQIRTEEEFGDFELICDWRLPRKPATKLFRAILPNGDIDRGADGKARTVEAPDAGDSGILLRGSERAQINIWCHPVGSGEVHGYRGAAEPSAEVRRSATPSHRADRAPGEWNRFEITLRGDQVTVVLNGERVIDGARLPAIPARGPIVLQHHDGPVEFANIFIRELDTEESPASK